MKKLVLALCLLFFIYGSSAVGTDMKETYAPKETVIASFSEDILSTIYKDQVSLLKDGHIPVAFEYDVKKLGTKQYLWFTAPANQGNYTIKVNDIIAMVGGTPQVVDYTKQFRVSGAMIDYSIKPGAILATADFEVIATLYESSSKSISVDFPSERQVTLVPGANSIFFSIQGIVGTLSKNIVIGRYSVPVRIIGAVSFCGDGLIQGSEVCDGTNLNGKNCTSVSGNFSGGNLKCASNCLNFDTGECTLPNAVCGAGHLGLCLTAGTCLDAGGYWYGGICNAQPEPLCNISRLDLCLTNSSCVSVGGYWYNSSCHIYEQSAVCDSQHLKICKTHGTCLDAGGYWYNSSCNEQVELRCGDVLVNGSEVCDGTNLNGKNCSTQGFMAGNLSCYSDCMSFNTSACFNFTVNTSSNSLPVFRFTPAVIRSTILVSEDVPAYTFQITNVGEKTIDSLYLDYDKERFVVEPDEEITLEPNESESFTLTMKQSLRSGVRGVILAYSGDVYEYLVFNINITSDEDETGTQYYENENSGTLLDCDEKGGKFCEEDQTCSTTLVQARDGSCCLGLCASNSSGSRSWIGYLIVGIAIVVLLIIYVKYRKVGPGSDPLGQRVSKIERKFP